MKTSSELREILQGGMPLGTRKEAMNPFPAVGRFFQKVFGFFSSDKAQAIAQKIQEYAVTALPVVEFIASLTPTRADDEIIALFKRFALPKVEAYLALPQEDRGAALMAVAVSELTKRYPEAPVSQLRAAIELAVSLSRAK